MAKTAMRKITKIKFDIPSILTSLKEQITRGEITIEQATEELYHAGWLTYSNNIDRAKELLEIKD